MINLRHMAAITGGFCVATGLGLIMVKLIAVEMNPAEKLETASMDINPAAADEPVTRRAIVRPDKFKKVDIPPAPPVLEKAQARQPTEPISDLDGAIPDFDFPAIEPEDFVIVVNDRDAQPVVRIPPVMPPRAQKSGHCTLRFDVSAQGQPFNITATHCSERLFERPSIKAVERWTYRPKIVNGQAKAMRGVQDKIVFELRDERGQKIPE